MLATQFKRHFYYTAQDMVRVYALNFHKCSATELSKHKNVSIKMPSSTRKSKIRCTHNLILFKKTLLSLKKIPNIQYISGHPSVNHLYRICSELFVEMRRSFYASMKRTVFWIEDRSSTPSFQA